MKKIQVLFVLGLLLLAIRANAQHGCATDEHYAGQIKADPSIMDKEAAFNKQAMLAPKPVIERRGNTIIIPVVFHIFHNGGSENISKAQVEDAIRLLNIDYRRQNADTSKTRGIFKGIAADCNIEFRLATRDPQGRCTEGITRFQTPLTENGDDAIKKLDVWPADHYYNVWVVKNIANQNGVSGTILGYAQFPWTGLYRTDGVIIRHDMVGSIGTAANPVGLRANYGRVLTHETGHWLGLFHTFQGGCGDEDKVDDTPPVEGPSYGICLPSNNNTCHGDDPDLPDQYENYMDYSDGACQNMFSMGQKTRMLATIYAQRSMVIADSNLIATGVVNPLSGCLPVAHFVADYTKICPGTSVKFSDLSYQFSGSLTYQWSFPGGVPSSSSSQNPTVVYPVTGVYDAELIVSNAKGTDTLKRAFLVDVMPSWISNQSFFSESFETGPVKYPWSLETNNSDAWERTTATAASGSACYMVNNSSTKKGFSYRMLTDHYDMSGADATLKFRYSFAHRTANTGNTADAFSVKTSNDCGRTWITRYTASGAALSTVPGATPMTSYLWLPQRDELWKEVTVDLTKINAASRQNLRFMFEFVSDGGNNFYLDDINYFQIAGVKNPAALSPEIYPNPAGTSVSVNLGTASVAGVQVELKDLSGKTVAQLYSGGYTGNALNLSIPTTISKGMYLITVAANGSVSSSKLMIQ